MDGQGRKLTISLHMTTLGYYYFSKLNERKNAHYLLLAPHRAQEPEGDTRSTQSKKGLLITICLDVPSFVILDTLDVGISFWAKRLKQQILS